MFKLLHLLKLNLIRNKKLIFKIIINLAIAFIFVFCAFFYSYTIHNKMQNIYNQYASANQYRLSVNHKRGLDEGKDINYIQNYLKDSKYIESYLQFIHIPTYVYYSKDENWVVKTYEERFNIENTMITIDGINYKGENDYSYCFDKNGGDLPYSEETKVVLDITSTCRENIILKSEEIEFNEKFPDVEIIKGSSNLKADEIIFSEYLLKRYSIDTSNVIGKEIQLSITLNDGAEWIPCFKSFTVVGILAEEFYYLNSRHDFAHVIMQFSDDNFYFWDNYYQNQNDTERADWIYNYLNNKINADFIFDAKNYDNFIQLEKILKDEFGENVHISNNAIAAYIALSKEQKFFSFIFTILAFILGIVVMTNIINLINNIYNKKFKFYYTIKAMGFRNWDIFAINILEAICYLIIGSIFGGIFSIILVSIINSALSESMAIISFAISDFVNCFFIAFSTVGLLILLSVILLSIRFYSNRISDQLKLAL